MRGSIKVFRIVSSGRSRVRAGEGAKVIQVVGAAAYSRQPAVVLLEPADFDRIVDRMFLTLSSALSPPEQAEWLGSVFTGEYEISHVYEIKNEP